MEIPQSSSMIIIHFHRIFHDEMEKIFEEHTLRTAISAQHWSKIQLAVGTTSSTILRPIASLHHIAPKSMGEGDEGEFQPLGYPLSITEITLAVQIAAFLCL